MIHSEAKPRFQVSQWYARLSATNHGTAAARASSTNGAGRSTALSPATLQIGPLTIFRPTEGCEVATFGGVARQSAVLFDGYLFDRAQLSSELDVSAAASLAELVAAAYQRWGSTIFEKLHGRYLIAVWDSSADRFLIGHDALGRAPVYFAPQHESFWFSSNVLALASSGAVHLAPNRLSLALALLFYWPPTGQTFFQNIRRLPDGVYLELTAQLGITEHDYSPIVPDDDEDYLSEQDVLEQFEPRLIRAVDRCVELSPEGIMLSGGVDSVVVAALAATSLRARHGPALVAVSARSGRALSYEEEMQTTVADTLKMRHILSTPADQLHGADGVRASLAVTSQLAGPSDVYWIGSYMGFCRGVAQHGVNVLLTGSGGDDWLGVRNVHAADLIRRWRFRELLRFMKASTGTGGHAFKKSARQWLWAGGLRPLLDMTWARLAPRQKDRYHRAKWHERLPGWLAPDTHLKSELIEHLMDRRIPGLTKDGRFPRHYYRHVIRTMAHPHLPYEFETDHHVQALCGLRLLSPYHDSTLVHFLNQVPPRLLIHGERYKGLLRPVAARQLPGLGLENQRKSYTPESQDFALQQLRRSIREVWPADGFSDLARFGIVDPAAVLGQGDGVAAAGLADLAKMYTLLSAECWVGAHINV